ncbi:ribonuclease H-like domain-containing protein, partial [Tanacetum coccineum]
ADDDQPTLISKLDLSSPLHLHPNDYTTLTVVFVKLNGNGTGLMLLLNALWKQFDALVQLPRCTCHAAEDFKKHNQLMKLMQFLMGLDDCYMQIRSNILSRDELSDVRSAYAIISSEENNAQRPQTSVSNSRPANVTRPANNRNKRPSGGSTLVCEHCGFNGHIIDRCFKLIGYPADFRKRNNNNSNNQGVQNFNKRFINNNNSVGSSSHSFLDDQISKLVTLIKENSLNSTGKGVQANMAGTIFNNNKIFNKNFHKFFCLKSQPSASDAAGLIFDSGANQHLTYTDKSLVDVIDISYLGITVSHPNGTEASITRVGNMVLNKFLTLHDVLVVPEYCVSLMSIHKLARYSNLIVAFYESKCFSGLEGFKSARVWSEKCVLVGYSSIKKGYKLYSLERKQFIFSRDVKFVENMFPFKTVTTSDPSQDLNHSNFFDNLGVEIPDTPCDEERVVNSPNSDGSNSSQVGSPTIDQHENVKIHFSGSNGSATGSEMAATLEDNHNNSEGDGGNIQNIKTHQITRRSKRSSIFLNKYNDFVVDSKEACKDQHWVEAMNKEMDALYKNDTWEITDLPLGRKSIGEGVDFDETFSPVVKIVTVRCLINLVVQNGWMLNQLDINNAFLYEDLSETVYIDLPEGFFNPDDKRSENGNFTALLVYVDDIIITGNNTNEIENFKKFLKIKFEIKDLGKLKYFMGIEVLETNQGLSLSQRKYCLDLLSDFGLLACKPSATPLEQNLSITNIVLKGAPWRRQGVRRSLAVTIPLRSHLRIALRVLRYLKDNSSKGIHIVKQPKASLEAFTNANWAKCLITRKTVIGFYIKAMTSVTSEITWVLKILKDLEWNLVLPVKLFYDSQAAIKIVANHVLHERTKHLEIDLYFIREKILSGVIQTHKISSAVQPAYIFTKGLDKIQHENLVSKLGLVDVFQMHSDSVDKNDPKNVQFQDEDIIYDVAYVNGVEDRNGSTGRWKFTQSGQVSSYPSRCSNGSEKQSTYFKQRSKKGANGKMSERAFSGVLPSTMVRTYSATRARAYKK